MSHFKRQFSYYLAYHLARWLVNLLRHYVARPKAARISSGHLDRHEFSRLLKAANNNPRKIRL